MASAETTPPPSPADRQIKTMVRWLLYLVFVVIGYLILRKLAPIMAPVIVAGAVAYLLDGWVDALVARGVKRVAAVGLLLGGFLILVAGLVTIAVPLVTAELRAFIAGLPDMLEAAAAWLSANVGIEIPERWRDALSNSGLTALMGEHAGPLAGLTAGAVGGLFGFLGVLAELLLIPVFAFYIMVDWDHIVARVHELVPPRHRGAVADVAREIDGAVSTWIRGQLIVMSVLAVLYAAAFKLLGVHLGVVIGVTVGLLTIIPFLGTFVGAGLTALVIVSDWQGAWLLGAVAGVFVAFHILEAAVLTPKLVGKKVGLGELGALFAVLAGGQLLGFVGVLLAVPLAATVAVFVRRGLRRYRESRFFAEGTPAVAPATPPSLRLDPEGESGAPRPGIE